MTPAELIIKLTATGNLSSALQKVQDQADTLGKSAKKNGLQLDALYAALAYGTPEELSES